MKWGQREILFRAWREDLKIWFKNGDSTIYFRLGDFPSNVIPMIKTQYTGVEDVNGTKIFEGDILKNTVVSTYFYKVLFNEKDAQFIADAGCTEEHGYLTASPSRFTVMEIVGNVFQNPELVEKYKLEVGK